MKIGETVTNGHRFGDKNELYLFRLVALENDTAWVRHINGTFEGQYLTFPVSNLMAAK